MTITNYCYYELAIKANVFIARITGSYWASFFGRLQPHPKRLFLGRF